MRLEIILLWVATFGMTLTGYTTIVRPFESAIHIQAADNAALLAQIARMQSVLHNEAALRTAHERVARELSRTVVQRTEGEESAFLLRSIAAEARRAGVAILAIAPGVMERPDASAIPRGNAASSHPEHQWIGGYDIVMSLRGKYKALIAFLPRISLADPLLEIRTVTIHEQDSAVITAEPALRVDITAHLYHIAPKALDGSTLPHDT